MKKIAVLLLVALLAAGLTACGKISEAVGNKIGEKIIENGTGTDVDIDNDKVTIQGDNGETLVLGGTEWPKDHEAAKQIPEFKKGKIEGVYSTDGDNAGFTITISEVEEKDFNNYLADVKAKGFDQDSSTLDSDDSVIYSASNGNGFTVMLTYGSDKAMMISIAKS